MKIALIRSVMTSTFFLNNKFKKILRIPISVLMKNFLKKYIYHIDFLKVDSYRLMDGKVATLQKQEKVIYIPLLHTYKNHT